MEMSLPILSLSTPRYPQMPKRYEETRPVVVQDFTHRRILGYGHQIHRRHAEQIENEKLAAIRSAEEAVWQQAEGVKESAIEAVRKQAKLENDRNLRKLSKEMDKKLKEEGLKVEMAMQKLALEQVKEERSKGETTLKETVRQLEIKFEKDRLAEVAAVRTEERKAAELAVAKQKRIHESELSSLKAEMERVHKQDVATMLKKAKSDQNHAVSRAREEEVKKAEEYAALVKSQFMGQIKDLRSQIFARLQEIKELEQEVKVTAEAKKQVETTLIDTREEFMKALTSIGGFSDDQASFLMPSLNL